MRRTLTAGLLLVAVSGVAVAAHAKGTPFREADATCVTAVGIHIVGDGSKSAEHWAAIRDVIADDDKLEIVSDPPEDIVGKVALREWTIKHTYQGGPTKAYTTLCGHGGTCNKIGKKVLERFPELVPQPQIHCGDVSNILDNPTTPP